MAPTTSTNAQENLAPRWHTALLVALIVTVATLGSLLAARTDATAAISPAAVSLGSLVAMYLPVFVVDWGLVVYVSRVGRAASALGDLVGALPRSGRAIARDLALAALVFLVIEGGEAAFAALAPAKDIAAHAHAHAPSAAERAIWIPFALTAGFCEEVVYRGYLQKQLAAFMRRPAAGVVLQAMLFGVAHLDQGPRTASRFAVYAIGLGVLARWRRSLIPGIVGHVAVDLVSGLIAT